MSRGLAVALAVAVVAGLGQTTRGDVTTGSLNWTWTAWTHDQNGSPNEITSVGGLIAASTPTPPASLSSPAPTPAPPPADAPALVTPPPAPSTPSAPTTSGPVTGFLDMGSGPYPEAGTLTTGGAQPWYDSPLVAQFFGGVPNASQQASFVQTVLQRVEQTYQGSGIPITLTTNPSVPAAHTISVVSNTSYGALPNAIGITDVGNNGFSFIDKLGNPQSLDQLEWVLAHNIAHELMHAIGGGHHDTTGTYLDSGVTNWSTMTNPNAVFSQAAVQDILSHLNGSGNASTNLGAELADLDAEVLAQPVPEPATLGLWGLASALAFGVRPVRRALRNAA